MGKSHLIEQVGTNCFHWRGSVTKGLGLKILHGGPTCIYVAPFQVAGRHNALCSQWKTVTTEKKYQLHKEGGTRIWTEGLLICSQMLSHWAIPPQLMLTIQHSLIKWWRGIERSDCIPLCLIVTGFWVKSESFTFKFARCFLVIWLRFGSRSRRYLCQSNR